MSLTAIPNWLVEFWTDWGSLVRVGIILLLAVVLRLMLLASVKRIVSTISSGSKKAEDDSPVTKARIGQRAKTIGSVLSNFITWGITLVTLSLLLSEFGIAVGALIAGAGIVGAAVGFGAQSLVRDLISGLFIVFEDQFGVGDSVDLGQASGVVESVGLRVTQVRDASGTLWYVRNGEILRVGNQSQGWSRLILDVAVSADSDINNAKKVIAEACQSAAQSEELSGRLIGAPEVWGLEAISGDQLVFRVTQQLKPGEQDLAGRIFRSTIKNSLDKAKIELSSTAPKISVHLSRDTRG